MVELLKSTFRGFGYPDFVEVILMTSRSVMPSELDLMSHIFDKVIIPPADCNNVSTSTRSLSRSNVLSFTLKGLPDGWILNDVSSVRATKWIVDESSSVVAVDQPRATNRHLPPTERGGARLGYIQIGGSEEIFQAADHLDLTDDHAMLERPQSSHGIICKGFCQSVGRWLFKPDFVILQDDGTMNEIIANAARLDIRGRLFSGRTGLESY